MIKPHMEFEFNRADEVAECWDGIGQALYNKLWDIIVPLQSPIPNLEDSGPHDHVGHENLAKYWHMLSREDQLYLNDLAVKRSADFDKLMDKYRSDS
jgi:hypothetical protein